MDSFELAERQLIAAFFLNYHRPGPSRLLSKKSLSEEFGIEVDDKIRFAVIAGLKKNGWVYGFGDGRSQLTDAGYKPAREAVLKHIKGTAIEVDWTLGEVLTDGELPASFPLPKRWKWMRWDNPVLTERLGEQVAGREVIAAHVLPLPEGKPPKRNEINWSKWGAIATGIGVIVAIVTLVIAG